jgi:hypothetical protein
MRTPDFTASMILAAALSLAACQTETPLVPEFGTVIADMHDVVQTHALRGTCVVTGTRLVSIVPPILTQTSTAECRLSLLGRVALVTNQRIDVTTGTQTAEGVWTTANGDQLFATSVGTAVPTGASTIRFSGVATIAGGTGRFLNAAGAGQVDGTADNVAGTGSFTYDGSIQFDASNAANR